MARGRSNLNLRKLLNTNNLTLLICVVVLILVIVLLVRNNAECFESRTGRASAEETKEKTGMESNISPKKLFIAECTALGTNSDICARMYNGNMVNGDLSVAARNHVSGNPIAQLNNGNALIGSNAQASNIANLNAQIMANEVQRAANNGSLPNTGPGSEHTGSHPESRHAGFGGGPGGNVLRRRNNAPAGAFKAPGRNTLDPGALNALPPN